MDYEELEIEGYGDKKEEEKEPYISFDIMSYPSDYTLSVIHDMWKNEEIVVPDYQRRFVWTITQSSLLIDSFLSGLPVPPVFVYIDKENKNVIIDGQQRILTIIYYFEGYFGEVDAKGRKRVFKLSGLDKSSPYYGKTFEELDEIYKRKLKQSVLRFVNVVQRRPSGNESSFYIFERLNTGGTPLNPQEIRNCVYRGGFNSILKQLNKLDYWRSVVGSKKEDKRMKDVELILRTFSLSGEDYKSYEKPMKRFMNLQMEKHLDGNTEKVKRFINNFNNALKLVINSVGEKPFHIHGPINASALDSVLSVIIWHYDSVKDKNIDQIYNSIKNNEEFQKSIKYNTTDTSVVKHRISVVLREFGLCV